MSPSVSKWSAVPLCLSFLGAALLAGCSASFQPSAIEPEQTPIGEMSGSVHGGQFPVTGAQIYLFAAGTGGYGSAATSLITSGKSGVICNTSGTLNGDCYVETDSRGNFALAGDYTCTQGQQVYLVAVGGNPGVGSGPATTATFSANSYTITVASATGISIGETVTGSGVGGTVMAVSGTTVTLNQQTTSAGSGVSVSFSLSNTAIVQMAAAGQCPAAGDFSAQVPYVVINEVTTVAFAYAMGSYATDAYHVGAPNNTLAQAGIAIAMANANNIAGIGWGGSLAVANANSNSVAPQSKINTLADILATCVNTTSSTSSGCSSLFNNAENASGTKPSDEATAIFNIVHNPTKSVSGLYGLYPSTPVFTPTLSAAPADWTLPVVYSGVVGTASAMAFDGSGNAWIADSSKNAVVKLSSQGAMSTFTNGGTFGSMTAIAVNPVSGNVWASDATNNKVYILSETGTVLTTITTGSLNKPAGIAFDRFGNGYVINSGAYQVDEYSSAGALVQASTYPSSQGYSTTVAVDYSGDVYTGAGTGKTGAGVLLAGATSGQFFSESDAAGVIALDATSNTALVPSQYWTAANNIWTISASAGIGWRYYFYTTGYTFGGLVSGTYIGYSGGITTATAPSSMAFDGAGSLWVANSTPTSSTYPLSGFTISGTSLNAMAANGFSTGAASGTGAYLAVPDGAGNVWVVNKDSSVSQVLGIATPVVTPMMPGKFCTEP